MIKRLVAKVQKISPNFPASTGSFSGVIELVPEDASITEKKGVVYAVFDLLSTREFDTGLVTKVIHDVLKDSYFESENVSPIQSIEKAIADVRDRVIKLTNETITSEEAQVEFNILAGVLWGNVMYVVHYGKSGSFLMREGTIKPINATSEGSYSAASGVVKEEDVIFFATQEFMNQVSPDKLLNASVDTNNISSRSACVVLKFIIDPSFTETEVVDFSIKPVKKPSSSKLKVPSISTILAKRKLKKGAPSAKESAPEPKEPEIRLKRPGKIHLNKKVLGFATAGLLLLALVSTWIINSRVPSIDEADGSTITATVGSDNSDSSDTTDEVSTEPVDETVFYDLKLVDSGVEVTELAVVGEKVIAADKNSGKVYVSSIDTPKFDALSSSFPGISSLQNIDGNLGFRDNEGYKIVDPGSSEVKESISISDLGVSRYYLGNIYSISGKTLTKYVDGEGSLWTENEELESANSMGISISIFVLKDDGSILKFTSGTQDTFSVTGLDKDLALASEIVTELDFDNMYIADRGSQRIVVLNKSGAFVNEITNSDPEAWKDIKNIGVSSDESKIFILNGTKVHEVDL